MDREERFAALRSALMQLDDLQSLRNSPLLTLLAEEEPLSPAQLQRLLLDAIDRLQNDPDLPFALAYDILYYRYVEQMAQEEVAFQIGVGVRQLRRYQNNALEYLADHLFPNIGGESSAASGQNPKGEYEEEVEDTTRPQASAKMTTFDDEIAWVRKSFALQVSRVETELAKALEKLNALTERFAVTLQLDLSHPLFTTSIPPTVLRQSLMNVLTAVIARSSQSTFLLRVTTQASNNTMVIALQQKSSMPIALDDDFWASIQMTTQLLQPFDSEIRVTSTSPLSIHLSLPLVAGIPILVVDDNEDARYLYRRYTAHSCFHIIDTGDSAEVLPLMERFRAAAIVMDIMMPDTDGWELLAQLRQHPLTANIPVVICSILPQEKLSHYLGATAFIQKPVSQQIFLATLDALLTSPSSVPNP